MGSKFSKYSYVVAIDLTHIHAWQATHTFFKPIFDCLITFIYQCTIRMCLSSRL